MSTVARCEKKQSDTYVLRWNKHSWWAVIFMNEDYGCLSIQSDFGDYSYRWNSTGRPSFKHFLVELNDGYLIDKLSMGKKRDYFDCDKTLKDLEKFIKTEGRNLDEDKKHEIDMTLRELKDLSPRDANLYSYIIWNSNITRYLECDTESIPCVTGPEPQLLSFVEKLWPEFIKVLKKEIADAEKEGVAAGVAPKQL